MATHLIRRHAALPTSPPPFDIKRLFLNVSSHPPYSIGASSGGRLHGACAPRCDFFWIFVNETIQEMSERIECEVWTARQRFMGDELTRQKRNRRVGVVN